ncbi:unnamed protein product, partial [Pylaiella littoralis]
ARVIHHSSTAAQQHSSTAAQQHSSTAAQRHRCSTARKDRGLPVTMRTFNVVALSAGAAVLLPSAADGFMPSVGSLSAPTTRRATAPGGSSPPPAMMMASYADKLRAAKAAKAAAARGDQASPLPPPAPAAAAASSVPRGSASAPLPQVAESPFSASLQEELRVAITTLSGRLQREKPMTRAEFERFESAVAIIVEDALPLQELPAQGAPADAAGASAVAAAPSPPVAAPRRLVAAQSPVPPVAAADSGGSDMDDEVEGPQWDAKKVQYGLPVGARNTYSIDDMDKMSPDEYQAALRQVKKVVNRAQSVRKTGSYGNIVSNEYLKFLGKNPKSGDEQDKRNEKFVRSKGNEDFGNY